MKESYASIADKRLAENEYNNGFSLFQSGEAQKQR